MPSPKVRGLVHDACATSRTPRVEVSTAVRDDEVELAVRDNGTGLSDGVRQRLFQSFFTTKAQGLGLGLAIVHSIVERHQGRIQAENHDDGGAVFRIVLPALWSAGSEAYEARLMQGVTEPAVSH